MADGRDHALINQQNYDEKALEHAQLGLNSTLFLAYRDIPNLLSEYLFSQTKKDRYRVLDYGCGAGLSTETISKLLTKMGHSFELVGIDINQENLSIARGKALNANFLHLNEFTANQHGFFDLIICNFVLVENKDEKMVEILKLLESLLDDGGILICTNCSNRTYKREHKWASFSNDFDENKPEIVKEKMKFRENQPVKIQEFTSIQKENSFVFFDFFHSGSAYKNAYETANLSLLKTHKPLGKDSDGLPWVDEQKHSPYKVHILKRSCPRAESKHKI